MVSNEKSPMIFIDDEKKGKTKITITCLGDSMFLSQSDECPELKTELEKAFPELEFDIINCSVGGSRTSYGLWRITHDFPDPWGKGMKKSLSYYTPDIVILESFAYSNQTDGEEGLPFFRESLGKLVDAIRGATNAEIVFLVTIPPDREHFVENLPNYYGTPLEMRQRIADRVEMYLKEAFEFAKEQDLILADAYNQCKRRIEEGESISILIDQSDNIHPSRYGHIFIASVIANTLREKGLIKKLTSPLKKGIGFET